MTKMPTLTYLGVRGNDFGWADGDGERIRERVGFLFSVDDEEVVLLTEEVVLRSDVVPG